MKTLRDVETRIPLRSEWLMDHTDSPTNIADGVESPQYQEAFGKILKDPFKVKDQYYLEEIKGKPALTYLRSLPNFQQCFLCHGSEHQLRGVLMISTSLEGIYAQVSENQRNLFFIALGALVIIGAVVKISMHRVVAPVHQIVGRIEDIAEGEGDLTQVIRVQSQDEIGQVAMGFNRFVEKLRGIIATVFGTVQQVTQAVNEVLNNTKVIAHGSEVQAEAIESTSRAVSHLTDSIQQVSMRTGKLASLSGESTSAIIEISSSIREIAREADVLSGSVETVTTAIVQLSASTHQINENVERLSLSAEETATSSAHMEKLIEQIRAHLHSTVDLSNKVANDSREGESSVDQAIEGIQQIQIYSDEVGRVIHRLHERTEDIGKILDVIAEVADQTNLLALNAFIIAAQSGEHGKGFSVVAREIKELAERSTRSTQEIHDIIAALQSEGEMAVNVIEKGSRHVSEGVARSQRAREALGKIMESSQVSAERIKEIAKAVDDQGRGVKRVAEAMRTVNGMIKEIARTIAEQKKSTRLVMENAEGLQQIAEKVKGATQEQSKGNQQIHKLVEDLNRRVREIVDLTEGQESECGDIHQAVEQVRSVMEENIDAVGRVGYAVEVLRKQSVNLETEISRFKVQRDDNADQMPKLPDAS